MKTKKTAILIFANSSQHEVMQKPLPSKAIEALNASTLKMVEATNLPYFHYSENEQIGTSFGARFTNAIQSVFSKGFANVITIGNDTPHLSTKHILKSAKALETKDCVLGPSKDGGFYLMGLRKTHFNANAFLKLPWQTAKLTSSVYRVLKANKTETCFLEQLQDIDVIKDIEAVFNSFKTLSFYILNALKHIYKNVAVKISYQLECYLTCILPANFNKGSPII